MPCVSFRRRNPAWRARADRWERGAKTSESTVASAPCLRSTSCRVTRTDTWLLSRALQRREEASGSQSPRLHPASLVFHGKLKTEIQKVFKMLLLQRRDGLSRIRSHSQKRSPSPARHRTAHVWVSLFFILSRCLLMSQKHESPKQKDGKLYSSEMVNCPFNAPHYLTREWDLARSASSSEQ